jgi:hypothetical protein
MAAMAAAQGKQHGARPAGAAVGSSLPSGVDRETLQRALEDAAEARTQVGRLRCGRKGTGFGVVVDKYSDKMQRRLDNRWAG